MTTISEAEAKIDQRIIEQKLMYNDDIRYHMSRWNQKRWGLPIIRCTYKSQERWDRFMSLFYKDIKEIYLQYEEDLFLQDSLSCPVIEDKVGLEGATWKEARERYHQWTLDDMRANSQDPDKIDQMVFNNTPYWGYFIYIDEASLVSVLDTPTAKDMRSVSDWDCWCTIVASALWGSRSRIKDAADVWHEDYEGGEAWGELYKKVKVCDFVLIYHTLLPGSIGFERLLKHDWDDIWAPV